MEVGKPKNSFLQNIQYLLRSPTNLHNPLKKLVPNLVLSGAWNPKSVNWVKGSLEENRNFRLLTMWRGEKSRDIRRSSLTNVKNPFLVPFNLPKFGISPISTYRNWTKVIDDVHVHPNNRHNNHPDNHNYRNYHNKTTKKIRRIFVRQNLFISDLATWVKS